MRIDPGPWEVDKRGKHFRRVGTMIEYMPEITTTYGTFEAEFVPPPPKKIEEPHKKTVLCPFNSTCSAQCAMHSESGCGIATGDPPTIGRRCPFGSKHNIFTCREDCALWKFCNKGEKTK